MGRDGWDSLLSATAVLGTTPTEPRLLHTPPRSPVAARGGSTPPKETRAGRVRGAGGWSGAMTCGCLSARGPMPRAPFTPHPHTTHKGLSVMGLSRAESRGSGARREGAHVR